ncbi:MAG: sigma-70 family RNA polymerase sigma factor [Anaerolineales bacterium]|nr:sigma-70 family RNA polymerase sigma factor [Anaerolineales bacterium]
MVEIQKEWLLAAREGDVDAFGRVVDAFQKPVFNLCYRMLGNPEDAEDAAQESFWRAYQGLSKYDFQRPFGTWMLSIAAHYCIDRLRRKRPILLSLESLLPEDDAPDETPNPEDQTHRKQEQEAVQQLLSALGREERAMIVMRYWHDMSYEEIARSLKVSVGAVKSRLHRARHTLAERWPVHSLSPVSPGGGHE